MREMNLTAMDWTTLNSRRGEIVEKLSQIYGS